MAEPINLNDALGIMDQDEEQKKAQREAVTPSSSLLKLDDAVTAIDAVPDERAQSETFKALRQNPDQYAKDKKIADRAQLPVEAIQIDKEKTVENRLKLEDIVQAIDKTPSLKKFAAVPGNMALAHDDVGALTRIADVGRGIGSGLVQVPAMTLSGLGSANAAAARLLSDPVAAGFRAIGADGISRAIDGNFLPWWVNPTEILQRPGDVVGQVADVVAPPEERRNFATDVGTGVGQLTGQIAIAIMSGGLSSATSVGTLSGQGFDLAADLVDQSGSEGTVGGDIATLTGGPITALTERFGLDVLLKRIPAAQRGKIMQMFMSAGSEASQEVVEGVAQRLTAMALHDPDIEIFDGIEREGLVAGTVGGIAGLILPGRTATRSQRNSQSLAEMNEVDSKLKERDPAKFAEYQGQVLRDNGVSSISLDSDAVTEYAQSGGDMSWVESLGLTEEGAFEMEQLLGTNIELTPEQYAAMPLEVQQAFREHTAINEDMTESDATEYLDKGMQEEFERMTGAVDMDEETTSDFDTIKNKTQEQLESIGYDPEVADSFSTLEAQRAVMRAQAAGQPVLDLWASNPTVFVGPDGRESEVVDSLSIDLDKLRSGIEPADFLRMGKRNVIDEVIARGGIDPNGTTAGELKARGVTPANARGLFREGGMDIADNVVASEVSVFAGQQFGEEFNSYVPTDTLLDAITDEVNGTPQRSLQEQEQLADFEASVVNLQAALDAAGLTVDSPDAEIRAALQAQSREGGREFNQVDVESEAFKQWFGNSQAIDENGAPLVMYHATPNDIEAFTPGGPNIGEFSDATGLDFGQSGRAIWLSPDPTDQRAAHNEAPAGNNVMPLYVSIKTPLYIDDDTRGFARANFGSEFPFLVSDEARASLIEEGYDGVISQDAEGNIDEIFVLEATQVKSTFNQGTFDPNDARVLNQSAGPLQSNPVKIEGTGPGGRVRNWDFAQAMTDRHMEKYGRALDVTDQADFDTVLQGMQDEYDNQQEQEDSGNDWYLQDINKAIETTKLIIPELADPEMRDAFLTIAALLSPQQKPAQNWENAILAMQGFVKDGKIALRKPSGKQFGVGSHTTGLQMFQALIDQHGLAGAIDWVREPHTGREMAQFRIDTGIFSAKKKIADALPAEINLNGTYLGIYMMGPKVGDFMMNATGFDQDAVTVDLWLARTYNRMVGRLQDVQPKAKATGKIASELRGAAERNLIKDLVKTLAENNKIDPSAMQAALWYFEQRLYRNHGINSSSENFEGAARKAAEARSLSVAGADQAAPGPDGTTTGGSQDQVTDAARGKKPFGTQGQGDLFTGRFDGGRAVPLPTSTDPASAEGRTLVAKFVAGVREPGGPDVALSSDELVEVAFAIAVRVSSKSAKGALGAVDGMYSPRTGVLTSQHLTIDKSLTGRELFRTPMRFKDWLNTQNLLGNNELHSTFSHEVGHLVDNRNRRSILPLPVRENTEKGTFPVPDAVRDEMVALSKKKRPGLWAPDAVQKYGRNAIKYRNLMAELFADSISSYMDDPAGTKETAPAFAAFLRETVNDSQILNHTIQFNQANRASIKFEPDRTVIHLPASSDLSSLLHENGHKWLEELRRDSLRFGQASPQLATDWNTVVEWWGQNATELKAEAIEIASNANDTDAVAALAAMSDAEVKAFTRSGDLGSTAKSGVAEATGYISVAMHEQWARGTEDYFRTGHAPTVALQDAFNNFKTWLVSIYSAMKSRMGRDALNVQFTPEVRAVMDRMLATEADIALVQNQYDMAAIFSSPAEAGMTQKQFEKYQRDVDRQVAESKERQLAKHIRSAERAKKKWWQVERAKILDEVSKEVAETPAYRAVFAIINGTDPLGQPLPDGLRPMRLNRRDVDLEFENADSANRLPQLGSKKLFATGDEASVHPDILAPAYGYESGLDMLMDIANHVDANGATPRVDMANVVDSAVEERMKEKFGSMELTQEAREEAVESVHGDRRGNVLLDELNALRESGDKLKASFVRQWARDQLVKHKVGDIKPSRYLAKQRKYARLASKALKAGDRVEAARMKFREALNFHMAQQSYKQRAQLAKDQKYLAKFSAKKTNFKNVEAEYVARIKSILGAYQLGPRLSDGKRNDLEKEAFTLWIARAKKDDGALLMVPQEILNADNNTHFRDLTLEEWQTLVATIKNIEAQGRNAKKAIRADEMLQKEQVVDAILETMDRLKVTGISRRAQNTKPAFYDPALHRLKEFDASMTKIEFLVEFLDGGVNGAAHEAIFQPFANAENAENLIVRAQSEQFAKMYQSIPKDQRTNMHKLRWNAALGRNVSRSELLHMALNVGNDSNLSKMARGSAKTKNDLPAFTEEQALEAVEALSKEEWVFIQGVWDLFEAQRPAVEEVFKRENGDVMTNVPSREIVLPHGTYKGGYFPMIYDPAESSQAQKIEDKSALEMMASEIVQAGVFSGMTKERNEGFSAPVLLDITRVAGELQKTAHFITHYEAVRSAKKIIGDPRFEKAVVQKMGNEYYRILDLWVGQVAAGGRAGKVPGDTVGNIVEQFRSNATVASMGGLIGGSVTTILSQPLGVTTSIDALSRNPDGTYRPDQGALRMLKGYLGMMTPGGAKAAMAASKELPFRLQNSDRDIKHVLSKLQGTRGSKAQIQRMMLIGIPFVQLYTVDMPTWIAAYNAGLKNGMGDGDAANYADSLIRKAQGSGSGKDLSSMMAQRGTARAFTMFMTFFNTLYNIQRRLGREAEWTPTFANKVVSGSILLYVIPSMIEGLFRMEGPDDDEGYAEWLALQAALMATSTVPLVRDVASGALGNFGYGATPLEGFGNSVATMVNSVGKMIDEDEDLELKDLKGAVSLLGFGTGRVPSSFINRIIRTFESMEAGEDPGIWSFFVGPKREQ